MSPGAFAENRDRDRGRDRGREPEEPFGAAVILIELTDNDIELQVFADAFDWTRVQIFDPRDRKIFDVGARGRLRRQGGMSEIVFASEPSHYLVDEDNFDEPIVDFLRRWPAGVYEFEGRRTMGQPDIESEAVLSHVLPALPEVLAPAEDAVVPFDQPLLIAWTPVTEQFTGEDGTLPTFGDGTVTIIEYQVIVNQEAPSACRAVDRRWHAPVTDQPPGRRDRDHDSAGSAGAGRDLRDRNSRD